eukprot:m.146601 g.146601  ORF g.146601 m.146601 type:complete len:317 (+) comp20541_c0_seq4:122-1072(+)
MASSRTLKEALAASTANPVQKSVIKATDHESNPPKAKHMEALLTFTHHQDVGMEDIAESLFQRLDHHKWTVVTKTLIVFHRLLRDGHERFATYMMSRSQLFDLERFDDRKTPQGPSMSQFARRYSAYLNEKIATTRQFGFDLCHVRGSKQAKFGTLAPPELFKNMELLQGLMDSLLSNMADIDAANVESQGHGSFQIEVVGDQSENTILKMAVYLLYQDVLRIFVTLNDGIVNILERYFTLQKKDAQEAYKIYVRFVDECGKMDTFLASCKSTGVLEGKSLPDLQQAPTVLMPKMKEYIDNYGSKKARYGYLSYEV